MLTKTDKEYIKKGCHDISNIISLISGNYQLLEITEPSLKGNSRWEQLGDNIRMLIDAMAAISLYRYSDHVEPVPVDTVSFIKEIIDNVRTRTHTAMLDLSLSTDSSVPMISADKEKISYIINSLMDNIADCRTTGSASVKITYDNSNVYIRIADTLPGFDSNTLSHLFEPFNSCKSDHIGLSLASSHNIMAAHGGELTRCENPDGGSTFTLRFPLSV